MLALAAPSAAFAQDKPKEEGRRPASATVSERFGKALSKAIELLNKDDAAGARALLADISTEGLSPYEISRLEQVRSSIEYTAGNYPSARQHLQKAIDSGGFSESEILNAKYQIAQLFIMGENYDQGIATLKEWFKATPAPNSAAYYLLAVAYYQKNDLNAAFEPAKKAVELSENPQAGWIELLLGLYLQRENYNAALPLLERLTAMQPQKKDHWLRLASLYQQREEYAKALAAIQIAYNAGYFKDSSEYERLFGMLRFNDIPFRAARVLEQAIENKNVEANSKNYEKLADAWIQTRDYDMAIPPLTRAAELSKNGELFMRLGQVQIQLKQWPQAVDALQAALKKGELKDAGQANLLAGIALFNLNRLDDALKYFQRATRSEKFGDMASDYVKLIRYRQRN
ncbi:MAG TPA: tetratricopeptide repeat protein [Gammaproteobacteria bacterium]|nr:tetratricopeptide repeat protein [Gammaproteobacteria bacterium]